jgi:hypothetical protein
MVAGSIWHRTSNGAAVAGRRTVSRRRPHGLGGGHVLQRQQPVRAPVPLKLGRLLLSINGFRLQCKLNAGVQTLADAVARVLGLATDALPRMAAGSWPLQHRAADCASGLAELRELLDGLRANRKLAAFDLAHAMDALIIDLVRLMPLWDRPQRMRPGIRRMTVRSGRSFRVQ